MTIGELARAAWFPFSDEPVLKKRWYLPRLESPSVLTPASSPDGKWHLFCQSWIGIQHFFSSNGIVWHALGRLNVIGTDPCVVSEMGMWYLFVARDGKRLCVHASEDLRSWGPSKVVFEGEKGQVVSHPQPCKAGGQWRLYYSLGENELERGRTIPLSVAVASAPAVDGPYRNPGHQHGRRSLLGTALPGRVRACCLVSPLEPQQGRQREFAGPFSQPGWHPFRTAHAIATHSGVRVGFRLFRRNWLCSQKR